MKKLTGRFAAILLIAAMVMTMVSGCSNNASNETTKANAGDGSLAAAGSSAEDTKAGDWHDDLPEDFEIHQMRAEYKKSAVYKDVIMPRVSREEDRIVAALCGADQETYAVVEFQTETGGCK